MAGGFIVGVVGIFVCLAGMDGAYSEARSEAVEAGHAEYYLDEDNERQWRWLEHTNSPPPAPAGEE